MKRMLSVLLTLVMVFSVFAATCLTAFAEQEGIREVTATVSGYEVGKSTADVTVTVPEGANYKVEVMGWEIYNYGTDNYDTYSGLLENDKLYKVCLKFIPNEGFTANSIESCWINGQWGLDMTLGMGCLEAAYLVNHTKGIDSVALTGAVKAEVGAELPFDGISIPEDAMYTVDHVEWSNPSWDRLPEGTKFEDGEAYFQFVYLRPKEGWSFARGVTATMNGKKPANSYNEITELKVQLFYNFTKNIASVVVTGLDKPAAGQAPDTTVAVKMDDMEVPATVIWYDSDGNQITQFAEKGIYEVEIEMPIPRGYAVPWEVPIMLDGEAMRMSQGGSTLYGRKIFALGCSTLEKVEITAEGFDAGKNSADAKITVKDMQVLQTVWGIGDIANAERFAGKFETDTKYLLVAAVELPEGYIVGDSTQVYFNGKLYSDSEVELKSGYAVVSVWPLELKKPVTPVTGDNMPVEALMAVMVLSAAMLVALPVMGKKKQ